MTARFADTWFFQAFLSEHDQYHHAVLAHLESNQDFIITTRWVLAETANAASGSAFRNNAARFLQQAESDPGMMIVGASDDLYSRGLDLYLERQDKNWSLTD